MGEIIRIDFTKSPDVIRRKHNRREARARLRTIAVARRDRRSSKGELFKVDRSELDTIGMEAAYVRSVSGRRATPEQIANNLHLDLGDVKFAMALLEVEAREIMGPLHAIMEPEFIDPLD